MKKIQKNNRKINNTNKRKKKDVTRTIEKRYNILIALIILLILVLSGSLFYFQIIRNSFYIENLII